MIPLRDLNPTKRVPLITIILIGLNVVAFLYEQTLSTRGLDRFILQYGTVPSRFTDGSITSTDLLTLFTSMFLHAGWLHIAGNMLYLWIFGNNIEDRLGIIRFIVFYFLGGIAAAALQIIIDPTSRVPMIGASGAIAGVLGGYIVLYPRAKVQTLIFFIFNQIINLPAVILLGVWFFLQLLNGFLSLDSGASGGVAFFAHIGGFIAGMVLIRLFTLGRRPDDWWQPPPTNWPPTQSNDRWYN